VGLGRGGGCGGVRAKAREVAMWRRRRVIVGRVHGVSITAGEMPETLTEEGFGKGI